MTNTLSSHKIMSTTESIKNIYGGPFHEYLRASEKIGGPVYEQSKLVDILFLLEINLIDITQKYKKPISDHDENVFLEPINTQIEGIRKLRIKNELSRHADHLSLISESTGIFDWMKQADVEETLKTFNKHIAPFINTIRLELLKLDMIHADWLYAWNCCLEDLTKFLVSFYKNGVTWNGIEKLPEQILLGDVSAVEETTHHVKLFKEINRGSNITTILRQTEQQTVNNENAASGTEE